MRLNSVAMFGEEPICVQDDSDKLAFLTEIKKTPKMIQSASKFGEKKRSSRQVMFDSIPQANEKQENVNNYASADKSREPLKQNQ